MCVGGSVCHFMAEGSCYYHHTVGGGGGWTLHVHAHTCTCTFADVYDMGYYVYQIRQCMQLLFEMSTAAVLNTCS